MTIDNYINVLGEYCIWYQGMLQGDGVGTFKINSICIKESVRKQELPQYSITADCRCPY
jgi:hypothetical protein